MAKPRFLGKTAAYTPNARRDLRFIKRAERARESKETTAPGCKPTTVAAQIAKEKEAPA